MSKKNKEKEVINENEFFNDSKKSVNREELAIQVFKDGKKVVWLDKKEVLTGWGSDDEVINQALEKLNK